MISTYKIFPSFGREYSLFYVNLSRWHVFRENLCSYYAYYRLKNNHGQVDKYFNCFLKLLTLKQSYLTLSQFLMLTIVCGTNKYKSVYYSYQL